MLIDRTHTTHLQLLENHIETLNSNNGSVVCVLKTIEKRPCWACSCSGQILNCSRQQGPRKISLHFTTDTIERLDDVSNLRHSVVAPQRCSNIRFPILRVPISQWGNDSWLRCARTHIMRWRWFALIVRVELEGAGAAMEQGFVPNGL
jgi:hypothetical protein